MYKINYLLFLWFFIIADNIMRHLGSAFLRTELLLLLFVGQLFRPLEGITHLSAIILAGNVFLQICSWIIIFFVPGWRWTRVFFDIKELGVWESGAMSIALSSAFVFFSLMYRKLFTWSIASRSVLTVVAFWALTGGILAVGVANRGGSSR